MRAFQIAAVIAACVALSACASKHEITSSTPRTVEIKGTAWDFADNQKAFDLAQAQCQKQGRHAALAKDGGSKPNAWWVFDCVL
ncbi:hypothetical protein QYQ99_03015 [Comamonas testosteroni]|uniref:hypothetical protein n=1 Tax=Comamonas testosteroni TaxID=285 RepID=UPI00265F3F4B|nr:hypothetical protein [Comamonas testosteroni]WKL16540.1 hypothetical protein QYQ99_03015 [Comamonas testosteroni]